MSRITINISEEVDLFGPSIEKSECDAKSERDARSGCDATNENDELHPAQVLSAQKSEVEPNESIVDNICNAADFE